MAYLESSTPVAEPLDRQAILANARPVAQLPRSARTSWFKPRSTETAGALWLGVEDVINEHPLYAEGLL